MSNSPKSIIEKYAKREFKGERIENQSYSKLYDSICTILNKKPEKLREHKYTIEQRLVYLELHNFENFVVVRLGLYAYILAVFALIFSREELVSKLEFFNSETVVTYFLMFGFLILITLSYVSNNQKDEVQYLKFKLDCIDELIQQKEKSTTGKMKRYS